MKRYLVDILDNSWRGSGDSKLNDAITEPDYYSREIEREQLCKSLDKWYVEYRNSTRNS
ncbi:MAG: hypothetical protein GX769_01290 [Erysipelothrix sp.]|nr:hypothetical protein [Erysipelothrix sp.]